MSGRQVCWSDPRLQTLTTQFVPATDEVWRLSNRDDIECRFFQGFSEQGHYGGRTQPTSTRQGIYCCTPAGGFLASVNTADPIRMQRMLEEALARWKQVPKRARLLDYDPAARVAEVQRLERLLPEQGLLLRVYSRDMPRKDLPAYWRSTAWNVDSLWIRKDEARALLPEEPTAGAVHDWPVALAQRLIRHNLVDNVHGQTNGYSAAQVRQGSIRTRVQTTADSVVLLTFEGQSETSASGTWARGVKTTLRGEAAFDVKTQRFTRFELVAVGTRRGHTRYNFREDDPDDTPIGFAVVLDEHDPGRRVAPAEVGAYGW